MPRKVFQVQVELCVHAVTCPGVWLCPSGKLSLQLYMLDSCVQSASVEPIFPLYFEERFVFCKQFDKAQRLSDLHRALTKECFYIELIQWTNCDIGNVLATFITSLSDALFPAKIEGVYSGIDVDLLMEPSSTFPGIIAPKIEITTKTTIEERFCPRQYKKCNAFVVNPKLVTSHLKTRSPYLRQRKVCHSIGYHKSRKHRCNDGAAQELKPPFVYKKPEEELLGRKPSGLEGDEPICKCQSGKDDSEVGSTDVTDEFVQSYYTNKKKKRRAAQETGSRISCHSLKNCPVCAKYSNLFNKIRSKPKISSFPRHSDRCECSTTQLTDKRSYKSKTESDFDSKASRICLCRRPTENVPAAKKAVHISSSNASCNCSEESCNQSSSANSSSCCCCSTKTYKGGSYHTRFYNSLEKFYDNLYRKTQENAARKSICY